MMNPNIQESVPAAVKVVGANGQISLGKEFAGKQVLVELREPGVWLIRTVLVVPVNEVWVHQEKAAADLRAALNWAQNNQARESNLAEFIRGVDHGEAIGEGPAGS